MRMKFSSCLKMKLIKNQKLKLQNLGIKLIMKVRFLYKKLINWNKIKLYAKIKNKYIIFIYICIYFANLYIF